MHFHALPHHHSYLIYAFEKPPSTSSTGAFEALHITGIPFTNISNFLKTNRCSCAMRRKLYFKLFVFQKPVARQLCWVFTMSSFSVTSDSRIIISSEARNLCYSRLRDTRFPHVCRAPLHFLQLSFIPPVPYPPLRGTFPSRGRLRYKNTAFPIQPPPLWGTSFQGKEGEYRFTDSSYRWLLIRECRFPAFVISSESEKSFSFAARQRM